MEIEIDCGLRFELNEKLHTASIIESPRVSKSICIPRFVQNEGQDYTVISIQKFAFLNSHIESITFSEDSEVSSFEICAFNCASIKKLQIPAHLKNLESGWCLGVSDLVEIEISPKNDFFSYIDQKYLVGKSQDNIKNFDVLHFARCDIEEAFIPPQIKIIKEYSFYNYSKLKTVIFPENSLIEKIEDNAFSCTPLSTIKFLSKNVKIGPNFFTSCYNLSTISFPNAKSINFIDLESIEGIQNETKIKVKKGAEFHGKGIEKIKNNIENIEEINEFDELTILANHIRFLEKRLSQYEKVQPFNFESFSIRKFDDDDEKNQIFIDESDESNHEIVEKIGEGATSFVYKVIDNRNSRVMCKKVLKTNENQASFENFKNIIKEFEVLHQMNHPSICKAIGINPQEKTQSFKEEHNENDNDDDDDEINKKIINITTAAIFIEFLPYKLNECLEKNILNNTLKARIAVEVAFGMSYIHHCGMMHRDLKIENVMLNSIFEAKIIDFGLVKVKDNLDSNESLTKGIGTLSYMSPEMTNEEEYDQKTDVYSYGVFLFVLFSGKLPKQSLKDKLNNKPLKFPQPSTSMSSYCIQLIEKCMSYEPSKRPSFDEIIDDLKNHSFELASEIDAKTVFRRYLMLNQLNVNIK